MNGINRIDESLVPLALHSCRFVLFVVEESFSPAENPPAARHSLRRSDLLVRQSAVPSAYIPSIPSSSSQPDGKTG